MSRASEAYERLSAALLDVDPSCAGVDEFTTDTPTADAIERMRPICAGCPLLELCGSWADLERPKVGLWAGKVYRSYKPRQGATA